MIDPAIISGPISAATDHNLVADDLLDVLHRGLFAVNMLFYPALPTQWWVWMSGRDLNQHGRRAGGNNLKTTSTP